MDYKEHKLYKKKENRIAKSISVSSIVSKLMNPILKNNNFCKNKIFTDWALIVGEDVSAYSIPIKLIEEVTSKKEQVLYVEIMNSGKSTEFTFKIPIILEQISIYFGYRSITKIKIKLNPQINKTVIQKQTHKIIGTVRSSLINEIQDDELKKKLSEFANITGLKII